jgi:hypothetical protein
MRLKISARLGLDPSDAIAVGDGANDLGMLELAGSGVALHAKPSVAAQAGIRIDHGDLTALLYLQGYRRSRFRDAMRPLRTQRLILRNWRESDRELFHLINSDDRVMEFFPMRRSRADSDQMMDQLADGIARTGFGLAAIEIAGTGETAGFAGLNATRNVAGVADGTVEIGWRMAPHSGARASPAKPRGPGAISASISSALNGSSASRWPAIIARQR